MDNVLAHVLKVVVDCLDRHPEFVDYFNPEIPPDHVEPSGQRGDTLCAILEAITTRGALMDYDDECRVYERRADILVEMTNVNL